MYVGIYKQLDNWQLSTLHVDSILQCCYFTDDNLIFLTAHECCVSNLKAGTCVEVHDFAQIWKCFYGQQKCIACKMLNMSCHFVNWEYIICSNLSASFIQKVDTYYINLDSTYILIHLSIMFEYCMKSWLGYVAV